MENIHDWSKKMQGAREMLIKLYEDDKMVLPLGLKRSEDRVYTKAIVNLLISDLRNVQEYLLGKNIGFRNHVRDKKGKLIGCEAYFVKKRTLLKRHQLFLLGTLLAFCLILCLHFACEFA